MVVFGQDMLYSGKVVVFLQNLLYSCKSGCNRDKIAVFGQSVVFGQSGCIRAKVVVFE